MRSRSSFFWKAPAVNAAGAAFVCTNKHVDLHEQCESLLHLISRNTYMYMYTLFSLSTFNIHMFLL